MRVILILLAVIVVAAAAGYLVRDRDRIAAGLLFGFAGVVGLVLVAAFFGWIGA